MTDQGEPPLPPPAVPTKKIKKSISQKAARKKTKRYRDNSGEVRRYDTKKIYEFCQKITYLTVNKQAMKCYIYDNDVRQTAKVTKHYEGILFYKLPHTELNII